MMDLCQEAAVCSDSLRATLRAAIMKVNLSNDQCCSGVQSHVASLTNEHQARDGWRMAELFNRFRFQIAMTTVGLTYTWATDHRFQPDGTVELLKDLLPCVVCC